MQFTNTTPIPILHFHSVKMTDETEIKPEAPQKPSLFASIRKSFFTGVAVALPIVTTIAIIVWFINFVDEKIKPLLPTKFVPEWIASIPGIGVVVSFVILWMIGTLASNFLGSRLIKLGEGLVNRVPLVRNIYNALKQLVVAVTQQKDRAFREVCLLEYPRKGIWAVGFVTTDVKGEPARKLGEGYVSIFMPTTPNPTSGFLLFVKRSEIRVLDMTVEEGAKMIISAGMVSSEAELEKLTASSTQTETLEPEPAAVDASDS